MSICGIIGSVKHGELTLFGDLSCGYMNGTYPVDGTSKVFICDEKISLSGGRRMKMIFGVVGSTGVSGLIKHWSSHVTYVGDTFRGPYAALLDLKRFLKAEGAFGVGVALSVVCLLESKSGGFVSWKAFNVPLEDDSSVIDDVDDICIDGYYSVVNGYQSETAHNLWMHCIQRDNIPMAARVRIFLSCMGRIAEYGDHLEPAFKCYCVRNGHDGFIHVDVKYSTKEAH